MSGAVVVVVVGLVVVLVVVVVDVAVGVDVVGMGVDVVDTSVRESGAVSAPPEQAATKQTSVAPQKPRFMIVS